MFNKLYEERCVEMSEIRNIVFDLGDVLLGYRWRPMLMDYGLTEVEADRVGREMFDDPLHLWHQFDLGTCTQEEMIREFAKEWPDDAEVIGWFIRHGEYMPVPRPKVWKKVHELKETGFPLYILSNYPEELFHKHTQYCDFMKDMDGMVISYLHHEAKPDPAIYDRLCRTYGLKPEETLFFDDRDENVRGALDYGMQARKVYSQTGLLADLDCLLGGRPFGSRPGQHAATPGSRLSASGGDEELHFGSGETPGRSLTDGTSGEDRRDIPASGTVPQGNNAEPAEEDRRHLIIAVYCGANAGDRPAYRKAAEMLGQWIGQHKDTLVYGAGALGTMGTVAENVQKTGGKVIGVIPQFMVDNGWQKDGLDELIVTDSMSSRKMRMMELADVYLALPGGPGTVDEIAEMISLSALHLHHKECILCSVDGYYEPLRQMYERMVLEKFSPEEKLEHTHFVSSMEEALGILDGIERAED